MSKRGTGSNPFENETLRTYYDEIQQCFGIYRDEHGTIHDCGRFNATDFHHNSGRTGPHDSSILNAVPLCRRCHADHGFISLQDQQIRMFDKVMRHLDSHGYKLNDVDLQYIRYNEAKFFPILVDYLNKKDERGNN